MFDLNHFLNNFSSVSQNTFQQIEELFVKKKLIKHEYFAAEGEKATKFGILTKGIIRGFYRNNEGNEYNKTFFIAPTFIGSYSSLITKKASLVNQQALIDCEIFVANYNNFEKLCQNNIELERLSKKIAQQHFVNKEKREIELVMLNATERYEMLKKEFPNIENIIPQYHIASYLTISPTQLSRIRNKISKSLPM